MGKHNAILLIRKGIQCVLVSQFNPSDPGKGMVKVSTMATTYSRKLNLPMRSRLNPFSNRQRNNELLTTTGKIVLPTFTTLTEAQEEANRLNTINQSVIGAKEGVVEAVSKLVGSDITDAILCTADGSDHKSIDDFTLRDGDGSDQRGRPTDHK